MKMRELRMKFVSGDTATCFQGKGVSSMFALPIFFGDIVKCLFVQL